ncbi:MAG TPA: hypothetical protein VHE81_03795 [Lacipirellulaceae bacterium]|nr:hypothetical protein [Lacipirellulaceae bacterium]
MRVSTFFKLNRTQPTLDFVDVDVTNDLKAFIDPWAIRHVESEWTDQCVSLIQNYFSALLRCAQKNDEAGAAAILRPLKEPNETHLGLSKGRSKGRALGPYLVKEVWARLRSSKAISSGLLEDIEDTMLLIDKIGPDIISDITSNILRGPLIAYTQDMCQAVGIKLIPDVDSGPIWSAARQRWENSPVSLPVVGGKKLILVPKIIVRRRLEYDVGEYYNTYILEHLQAAELNAGTELVRLLKKKVDGKPVKKVFKKDVKKKYGGGKGMILDQTIKHRDILDEYRSDKKAMRFNSLTHDEVAASLNQAPPDWDSLLAAVLKVPVGKKDAPAYETAIEALLTALLYPWVIYPNVQHEIQGGLKRIDITYSNTGKGAFFGWLAANYPSAKIMVECKNYGADLGNPELDQLSSRFSPNRGHVGIIVCRAFQSKDRFLKRCRATADDARGFVITLDDGDLIDVVAQAKAGQAKGEFPLLRSRFDALIM